MDEGGLQHLLECGIDVHYTSSSNAFLGHGGGLRSLSPSEARGEILHYQVTLWEVTRKIILQNITEHTSWTGVIPRMGAWTASVSAANSKGTSAATLMNIVDLCGTGLLAPYWVSAKSGNMDNILVTWQPPRKAVSAVREYIVEWRALQPGSIMTFPPHWLRIPPYNMSALISENISPYVCYEIRVHALSEDQGGCSSILGDSKHKEIPYRHSQNSYPISSLQPEVTYVLWMTALTAAGESPKGNEREFCLQGKANWKAFVASSICIAIITVGIFSIRPFRQKPQWYCRTIPDPANSTWVKKYPIVEVVISETNYTKTLLCNLNRELIPLCVDDTEKKYGSKTGNRYRKEQIAGRNLIT
ncbi:Interleukin-12 receptor beta-2 chain [Cricetulus griseus]|uniref:Interleukin-12 receptor beta-2 chain n=1 Tax=Cricetulus griseus TaxID=10029 RepID=G3I682_CRIGR|nr:Interleukin-12 receptor beta-2 chain [Cricetulus griseus]